MHPVLLEFGFVKIFSYGLLVASGFFAAIMYASRQAKREGMNPQEIVDLCFYIMIASLLGARLLYVLVEFSYFSQNPLEAFKFWKGGLVFYGGLIGGTIVAIVYMKRCGMDLWKVADVLAPAIAIGQGIGRWGCFFAGCCYGRPSDVPWAITFSNAKSLAPLNIALHPTQIYLSLNAIAIFLILVWLQKRKHFDGQILWTYGILYAVGRFVIEYFRNDDRGYVIDGVLSTSQFVGIIVFILSIAMWFLLKNRGEQRSTRLS
ncbi:MAG: prolipoprotein diacylglyceryl transferase [Candidatus Nitrohelix vancouverensis]|uniref:Phosphatidylglycerol--prolipoprotein diacylglyceryl transferase n=1 Tax=Candidatus Nitrohelix vancouverensis TaxID=2705534 RepID=A0A7T0C3C5_9BACT|nr:MAG: prolipoprotein diacylglyceryl transferase [Candidatus Nitrohelix vancouverensis]